MQLHVHPFFSNEICIIHQNFKINECTNPSSLLSIYPKTPDNRSIYIYTYKIHLPHILVLYSTTTTTKIIHAPAHTSSWLEIQRRKKKGLYSQQLQHKLCNSFSRCTTDWDISLPTSIFFNETEKVFSLIKNSCLRNQRWKIIIPCKSEKGYKTHPQNFQRKKVRLWAWMGYKYPIQQLCSCEEHVMMGIKTKENKRMNNISCRSKKNNLLDACALLWWLKEGNFLNISPKGYNCTWHQAAGAKSGKKPEL